MSTWFETKVRYDKVMDNGALKTVNEVFLVDAMSFTEAEARVTKEMEPYLNGDFSVAAVKKNRFMDVFFNKDGSRWYKVKVVFAYADEKTGAIRLSVNTDLVQANSVREALENFERVMSSSLADCEIQSIVETPILDVFCSKK